MCIKLQLPSFVESTGLSIKKKKKSSQNALAFSVSLNIWQCIRMHFFKIFLLLCFSFCLKSWHKRPFWVLLSKLHVWPPQGDTIFLKTHCPGQVNWNLEGKKRKKEKKSQQKDWFGNSAYRKYTQKGDVLFSFRSMFS